MQRKVNHYKTLSRCLSFDVVGVPGRIVGPSRNRWMQRLSGSVGRSGTASAHPRKRGENFRRRSQYGNRLEAFDIMGSTGTKAKKFKSRFARAAAGGKEPTGSERTLMLQEILKQLADLKNLMTSYRRDLDKQQQKITTLKRSHQPPKENSRKLEPFT